MSRNKTNGFDFKNVRHIKKINFGSDGNLISKDKLIQKLKGASRDENSLQSSMPPLTDGFTTVMCYAGWCGHCVNAKPVYDSICGAAKCTNAELCAIDCANDDEGLVAFLNDKHKVKGGDKLIQGFPTFIQFKNGRFYRRFEKSSQDGPALLSFILGV
jgi:thiol-disulfide isomerase/thioredoxin